MRLNRHGQIDALTLRLALFAHFAAGEESDSPDVVSGAVEADATPPEPKAKAAVLDSGNTQRASVASDPDDDEMDLKAQLKSAQGKLAGAERRAKEAERALTPFQKAQADREAQEENDRPLQEKLTASEEMLEAQATRVEELEVRAIEGDLARQLRMAGYPEDEVDDITDLALQDEIDYDEDTGRYALDLPRFVERKARYDLSKRDTPAKTSNNPQSTPAANGVRQQKYTDGQLARMSNEEYEKNRKDIIAASADGRYRTN